VEPMSIGLLKMRILEFGKFSLKLYSELYSEPLITQ